MLKRWAGRFALAGAVTAGAFIGTTQFVDNEVKKASAHGQIPAAVIDTLGSLTNNSGVAVWPSYGSDPFTCDSNAAGAYYFNTGTSAFRVCDGSSWSSGGGGVADLGDLGDVFISSPSNNDHLVYDGVTDNRWENAAASASAIGDLSDVTITSPSSGQTLEYNGSIWVNVAGSAASLAGLSDTDITSPAQLESLVFDGTDWVNVESKMTFYLFPGGTHPFGSWSISGVSVINADNQVKVFRIHIPNGIEVDTVVWAVITQTGTGCDNGAVGIYSIDGNTLLVDSGAQTYDTNNTIIEADITNVFLNPGDYWLAYTADESTSCTVQAVTDSEGTGVDSDNIMNQGQTMMGTANNASASGVLPATLGTITPNEDVDRPIIKLNGT